MDRDRLAAFADGELSPEEAAAVVMHLADHPGDQAYVDEIVAAGETLARAFAAPLGEPVPPALRAVLEGAAPTAQVLPFRRRAPSLASAAVGLALAAGLAAVAVMVPGSPGRLAPGAVAVGSALDVALDSLPAGVPQPFGAGRDLVVLASMPAAAGFCREFEVADRDAGRLEVALACRDGAGWRVEAVLAEAAGPAAGDGFVPAGGAETQALDAFLDRAGAGPALDPAAEAAAIARGWTP